MSTKGNEIYGWGEHEQAPGRPMIELPEGLSVIGVHAGFKVSLISLNNGEVLALGNEAGFLGSANPRLKANRAQLPYSVFTHPADRGFNVVTD